MKINQINITLEGKTLIDFRSYAGGKGKSITLLKTWIKDYVKLHNDEDQALLESHKKMRDSLTPQ